MFLLALSVSQRSLQKSQGSTCFLLPFLFTTLYAILQFFFCDCAINIWPQHLLAIDSFNGCPRLSPPHIQDKGTLVVFLCVVSFQRTKYISPASQAWCLGIFFCTIEHKSNLNKHLYYRKEFIKKSSRNSYFADFQ